MSITTDHTASLEQVGPDWVELHYVSTRPGFGPLMEGILHAVAKVSVWLCDTQMHGMHGMRLGFGPLMEGILHATAKVRWPSAEAQGIQGGLSCLMGAA